MAFSGFGRNSGPSAQPGAQTPFGNSPRHPSPSSPLPVPPRKARTEVHMDQPAKASPSLSPQPVFSPPPGLHQNNADEDDENVKQLGECSSVYIALQDCLLNNDRNWKSCQKEIQLLKACNNKRNN